MTTTAEIAFPQPHEIEGYWDWDKIHAPRPLTPLAGDAVVMSMGKCFTVAQHEFASSLALICRMINNYFYAAFATDTSFTPRTTNIDEYTQEREKAAARIGERWVSEWEPELIPLMQRARTAVYAAMSDQQLRQALEEHLASL